MPLPSEIILGKKWGLWVTDAARAIIAATTPPRRLAMVRAGFFTFQEKCKTGFAQAGNCPFSFTNEELRWMFRMLGRQVDEDLKRNPRLEREFERRLERKSQRDFTLGGEEAEAMDLAGDNDYGLIEIENYNGRGAFSDRGRRRLH